MGIIPRFSMWNGQFNFEQLVVLVGETAHIVKMINLSRKSEASFRIFSQTDKSFAIEVEIPESLPTTVRSFATEAAAKAWVARYKEQVAKSDAGGNKRSWQRSVRAQ